MLLNTIMLKCQCNILCMWSLHNYLFESLLFFHFPHIDLHRVLLIFLKLLSTFSPVIPKCIGKHWCIFEIVSSSDRPRCWLSALELALGVLVPKEVASVLAICSEGVKLLVERHTVDSINLGRSRRIIRPVALEAEIVREVRRIFCQVNILYGASSLDWTDRISLSVSKTLNACCCASKRRYSLSQRAKVIVENISEIPVMNKELRVRCNQEWELSTHIMDGLS